MNNKSKTIKTILFASLIAAMILPFSVMGIADAKIQTEREDNNVSKQLDREIKIFVNSSDKFSDNSKKIKKLNDKFDQKQTELSLEYHDALDEYLSGIVGENYDAMSNQTKTEMIDYVISEKFKEPIHKKFVADMLANETGISLMGFEIIPAVFAACSTQPDVYKFKQLNVDRTGQFGFEGDNDLESVQRNNLSSCLREYTLTFTDEDHPVSHIDANYDIIRLYEYGRIQDVEKFYVSNGSVWFLDSGSKSQSFWTIYPTHYQETDTFSNTVYISNTWNHLMDTSNTNSGASMKTWYK